MKDNIDSRLIRFFNYVIEIVLVIYIIILIYQCRYDYAIEIGLITVYIFMNHRDQMQIWKMLENYKKFNDLNQELLIRVNTLHHKGGMCRDFIDIYEWYGKRLEEIDKKERRDDNGRNDVK